MNRVAFAAGLKSQRLELRFWHSHLMSANLDRGSGAF